MFPTTINKILTTSGFKKKLTISWLLFGGLVIPSAIAMSFGIPSGLILPLMVVLIFPAYLLAEDRILSKRNNKDSLFIDLSLASEEKNPAKDRIKNPPHSTVKIVPGANYSESRALPVILGNVKNPEDLAVPNHALYGSNPPDLMEPPPPPRQG